MAEVRECAQCGTRFTPRREHARFCSARCRVSWNREHAGVAAAPAVAIGWSVTAMTEATGRLAAAHDWDPPRMAAAVAEAVWWVTLVDATLVRYHPRDYEAALASRDVRRRKTEQALEGLRYVRNQLGKSADPANSAGLPELFTPAMALSPIKQVGQPHHFSALAEYLTSSDADFVTGEVVFACGGRSLFPSAFAHLNQDPSA